MSVLNQFRRMERLPLILLVAAFFSGSAEAQLTDQDIETFRWFNQLGYEDYRRLPLVEATTGWSKWWSQRQDERPKNRLTHAFLISETKNKFTVYTLQLRKIEFDKTSSDTPAHKVVRFEQTDLAEHVKTVLTEHSEWKKKDFFERARLRGFGRQVSESVEFFLLANACASQNEDDLAQQLLVAAKGLARKSRNGRPIQLSFKSSIANDLAHTKMWRTIVKFGDPKISRQTIHDDLVQLQKDFPQSPHVKRAKETTNILAEMIDEDETHAVPNNLAELPIEKRVAELIFRLRDQNGKQYMQPGSCNLFIGDNFLRMTGKKTDKLDTSKLSPAGQLVDIGFDAVPQLIKTIGDSRLTRSVGYHRDFYFSHHVLTIGNCADRILARIANRRFSNKAEVEKWWRAVSDKGEQRVLIEGTISGNSDAHQQAAKLVEKYPDAALDAITKGISHCNSSWVRESLLRLAADLGEPSTPLLEQEMLTSPHLESRVVAAELLKDRKRGTALDAMCFEWQKVIDDKQSVDEDGKLIQLLATFNEATAMTKLRDRFDRHSVDVRLSIVTAIAEPTGSMSRSSFGSGIDISVPRHPPKPSDEVKAAMESLLITAMGDSERRAGISGNWGTYEFADPRVCDTAGHVLATRFSGKYEFDATGSFDNRESQRVTAINLWRKERGIELLPAHQSTSVQRLMPAKTTPVLDKIVVDGKRTHQLNGSSSWDHAKDKQAYSSFAKPVDIELSSPLGKPFEAFFSMIQND